MKQSDSLDRTIFAVANDCPNCGLPVGPSDIACPRDGTMLVTGLQAGTIIDGRYQHISNIGHGGMGLVVKAFDLQSEAVVALKMLLRKSNSADVLRFEQEARAASLLDHPNIIAMRHYGVTENGCPFLVMDYVEGSDLASLISQRGAIDLNEALALFKQLCETMSYAHSQGILHRDLKPSNIMIIKDGEGWRIKIVDFGIAKIVPSSGITEKNLTQTGQILGSPLYMSPEQALGKPVDNRTDIYSAACVLYHMLTGAPPIQGGSSIETLFQHVNVVPLSLTEASIGRTFSSELEQVLAQALSKDPKSRQSSFAELNNEIQQTLIPLKKNEHDKVAVTEPSKGHLIHRATIGALLVLCLIAAVATYLMNNRNAGISTAQNPSSSSQTVGAHANLPTKDLRDDRTTILDIDLTADGIARVELERLLKEKTDFIDFKTNDKLVSNKTIDLMAAELHQSPGRLRSLNLTETSIDDNGIKRLIELHPTNLQSLSIGHTSVSAAGLKALSGLKSLEVLDIHGLRGLKSDSLDCLAKLTKLKILNMNGCYPKASEVISTRFLGNLKSLESLSAASNSRAIGDASANDISKIPNIRFLDLSWSNFGDRGLTHLKNIGSLETLTLAGTTLTDTAIDAFAKAVHLKTLTLNKQPISKAALKQLSNFYEQNRIDLSKLNLIGCSELSAKEVSEIQQSMPHCVVNWHAR